MFTLILIYFHFLPLYEVECKILVKIPASVLDPTLTLQGKKHDLLRKKIYELSM